MRGWLKKRKGIRAENQNRWVYKGEYANPDMGAWEIAEACGISEKK